MATKGNPMAALRTMAEHELAAAKDALRSALTDMGDECSFSAKAIATSGLKGVREIQSCVTTVARATQRLAAAEAALAMLDAVRDVTDGDQNTGGRDDG